MKSLKPWKIKKSTKKERENRVFIGLVELFIQTGQPIGSNTLKNAGFQDLSSATIRNYFSKMEEDGYLHQQHSSGGRIPTEKAFREYANEILDKEDFLIEKQKLDELQKFCTKETEEVANLVYRAADLLSEHSACPVFISSPRFDHDFIREIKLLQIDINRCLAVVVTDFGLLQTHILHTEGKLKDKMIGAITDFFHWRLGNGSKPEDISRNELVLAQEYYNEIMVRYMVNYSNFSHSDIHYTGLSKLLNYPEFTDAVKLANGLSVFENSSDIESIVEETFKRNKISFWLGSDLNGDNKRDEHYSVISVPYYINKTPAGIIALLGPVRLPYKKIFGLMHIFSENISDALTNSLYKYKISFRTPNKTKAYLGKEEKYLLENKSQ